MIEVLHGLLFRRLMEKKSWQRGTTEKGGMRKGKCKSVCRTGKLSTISRGEDNQGQRIKARKGTVTQNPEEAGPAKPDTLKMAGLIAT